MERKKEKQKQKEELDLTATQFLTCWYGRTRRNSILWGSVCPPACANPAPTFVSISAGCRNASPPRLQCRWSSVLPPLLLHRPFRRRLRLPPRPHHLRPRLRRPLRLAGRLSQRREAPAIHTHKRLTNQTRWLTQHVPLPPSRYPVIDQMCTVGGTQPRPPVPLAANYQIQHKPFTRQIHFLCPTVFFVLSAGFGVLAVVAFPGTSKGHWSGFSKRAKGFKRAKSRPSNGIAFGHFIKQTRSA